MGKIWKGTFGWIYAWKCNKDDSSYVDEVDQDEGVENEHIGSLHRIWPNVHSCPENRPNTSRSVGDNAVNAEARATLCVMKNLHMRESKRDTHRERERERHKEYNYIQEGNNKKH